MEGQSEAGHRAAWAQTLWKGPVTAPLGPLPTLDTQLLGHEPQAGVVRLPNAALTLQGETRSTCFLARGVCSDHSPPPASLGDRWVPTTRKPDRLDRALLQPQALHRGLDALATCEPCPLPGTREANPCRLGPGAWGPWTLRGRD